MTEAIQSTDLRRRVRQVLDRVRINRQAVIVKAYDTPQAVIIPYEDFQAFQTWQSRQKQQAAWLSELQTIAEEVSARVDLSEEPVADLIEEASQTTSTW
jgi:prevent-host-death family protein